MERSGCERSQVPGRFAAPLERSNGASARGARQSNSTQWTMLSETVARSAAVGSRRLKSAGGAARAAGSRQLGTSESGARSLGVLDRSCGTVIRVVGGRACRMSGVSRTRVEWAMGAGVSGRRIPLQVVREGVMGIVRRHELRFRACVAGTPEHCCAHRGRGGRQRQRGQQRAQDAALPRAQCVQPAAGVPPHGVSVDLYAVRARRSPRPKGFSACCRRIAG